jgi:CspA family cold shock protein
MILKPILAVLGPAVVLALATHPLKLHELLPSPLLVFTVALMASVVTLFINARKFPRPAPSNRTAPAAAGTSKSGKEVGSVKWFNASKGFGFITRANGEEIFVHFRSINGQRSLRDGQKVEFAVTNGSKGLQAEDVVALK